MNTSKHEILQHRNPLTLYHRADDYGDGFNDYLVMRTAYFNHFNIDMPEQAVEECSHQGPCDNDVEYWALRIPLDITPEQLRAELKEYGAWDEEELSDHDANVRRIIWIAAGNIREESKEVV